MSVSNPSYGEHSAFNPIYEETDEAHETEFQDLGSHQEHELYADFHSMFMGLCHYFYFYSYYITLVLVL